MIDIDSGDDIEDCTCVNCVHRRAIRDLLTKALNGYLRSARGVPVAVIQCAIGAVVTATFQHVDHDERDGMLEQFCATLFESVEDMSDADVSAGRMLS
ncbi:hypothetical protein [Bradyrhizobium sp. 150]|uniref:hypothetical protein n=1 Tax=Bradyrhizobium sp. 150 TaxID=2782625 RepID=UPI001FF78FB6|nr:hypothetical protein [Bradyrhizobium sp. 150]MCK1671046.1 hypothetical protein [Bradyrhizobium sp. 150]